MVSPAGATEGDGGGDIKPLEGGKHSHAIGTRGGQQPGAKTAGGGVKKEKNKTTGKLAPLLGNESSLSTTNKQQQKEKFRSYEIYRKQSELLYQRLKEAKAQRGFRNEDDMMNFFRVLESSDATVTR